MSSIDVPDGFKWFKWAMAYSWLLLTICFVMMITAAVSVGHLSGIASDICAQPEITSGIAASVALSGKSCKEALDAFADVVPDRREPAYERSAREALEPAGGQNLHGARLARRRQRELRTTHAKAHEEPARQIARDRRELVLHDG